MTPLELNMEIFISIGHSIYFSYTRIKLDIAVGSPKNEDILLKKYINNSRR